MLWKFKTKEHLKEMLKKGIKKSTCQYFKNFLACWGEFPLFNFVSCISEAILMRRCPAIHRQHISISLFHANSNMNDTYLFNMQNVTLSYDILLGCF